MKNIIKTYNQFTTEDGTEFQIFQDMDGCMTDFEGDFKAISSNKQNLGPTEYDDINGKFSMWRLIGTQGKKWWSDMNWMSDGRELWDYIKQYDPIILSAPSRDPDSSRGKIEWLQRELGMNQTSATVSPKNQKWDEDSRIILNSQKYMFVKRYKNSILIDDTKKKITDWENNGGIGILHTSTKNTIAQLEQIISNL